MTLSHDDALKQDLQWLDVNCKGNPTLLGHIARLRSSKLVIKPRYFPWPEASTTIGPRTIYLARNWNTWAPLSRRANLIHESVHLQQYVGKSPTLWHIKYITSEPFRAQVEIEACIEELRLYKHIGRYVDLQHFVHHLIDSHAIDRDRHFKIYSDFESILKIL